MKMKEIRPGGGTCPSAPLDPPMDGTILHVEIPSYADNRCGSRIWSRGPQLLREVADVEEWSHASKASYLQPGSRAHLRVLEDFGFLVLKYEFASILETLFLSFLTSS